MNPPSALHSAMSRDRKPFTYTPGGINLSEIKSQRMAQRLMRNAMNPGVPEIPVHPVLPSATQTVPVALPNYNCLPVQVFPAMPANPKTLLRSRSNPDPRDSSIYRPIPTASVNNGRFEDNNDTMYKNRLSYPQPTNNNRKLSLNEYNNTDKDYNAPNLIAYNNDGYTPPAAVNLYSNTYKPAYGYAPVVAPVPSPNAPVASPVISSVFAPVPANTLVLPEISNEKEISYVPKFYTAPKSEQISEEKACEEKDTITDNSTVETNVDQTVDLIQDVTVNPFEDINIKPIEEETPTAPMGTKSVEENADITNEQREVKVVKKQVTKDTKVQEQNGNQNGDTNDEAEMTVKLPTKKSGAKTETKVEVERKTLPDGTIEEVKTTTTKTTIDGRTEIKTRTETTIIPKDEESEEEVVEEEEEEEEETIKKTEKKQDSEQTETLTLTETVAAPKQNGNIARTEERSEVTITKKIAVVQESPKPEQSEATEQEEEFEEEEEVLEEADPVTIVLKKPVTPEPKIESKSDEEEFEEEEEIIEEPDVEEQEKIQKKVKIQVKEEEQQEEEEQEEEEQQEEEDIKPEVIKEVKKEETSKEEDTAEKVKLPVTNNDEEEQEENQEYEEEEEEIQEIELKETQKTEPEEIIEKKEEAPVPTKEVKEETVSEEVTSEPKEAPSEKEHVIPVKVEQSDEPNLKTKEDKPAEKPTEFTIPIREPSVPLDKVEDIEIKPIGSTPIITKTHTENTEIITSTIDPSGGVSKQTEYNKIENIITVNRTTKILDQNYESLTQQGIPTVKTYFPPPSIDRFAPSPQPSRPYQPVYCPEPAPERRHSLLLERLSMERQMPSDIYQYSNQSYDQSQYQSEPQSEVLTVSNVKPSKITNQQWYQQTKQSENVLYNNVSSNPTLTSAPWTQPKSPQPQQQYQPQKQYQPPPQPPPQPQGQPQYQAQYQPPQQPQFQRGTTPQPQFQRGTTPQPQFLKATTPQPQYQSSYTDSARDRTPVNNYSSYSPKPTWVSNTIESTQTPYSYLSQDSTQSYQSNTLNSTTQTQYSSGYVPPPWEQDSSYTSVNNTSEKYYQEVPQSNAFSPTPTQGWKPTPPPAKFTKNAPIAYVPPAPNQSFVRPVVEVPRHPGRKTYYSEYERRYITVPESTYIPTETKFQPQPDPSPEYYYDNNEPSETVEPQWRKELREFTEKTSQTQTQTIEQTNVQPPWEADPKYGKTPSSTYTPTPTWSQTLRPQYNRERSFESEYVSQEWPKTNTLGRRRPLSTMGVSTDGKVTERVRGVSVDRYNPNNYQPPAEHPPVQTHTLTTPAPHASYHNPNVPAYHARASAEPREQPIPYQQRVYRDARASPLQSRSFKYLQWITGTEN